MQGGDGSMIRGQIHTHEPLLNFLMHGNTFGIPGPCKRNVTENFQANDGMAVPRIGLKRNVLKPGCP
ncbi:hypothetical protein EAF00_004523 [Botryotinia globosa]|nr:hypothetical protein EAF00_004523 [Botryotinia globosa]